MYRIKKSYNLFLIQLILSADHGIISATTLDVCLVQVETKESAELKQSINPISRLIQLQQAKKEKEPVYTLIGERGVPRRREFFMKVTVGDNSAVGSGPNKKVAKRAAAEVGISTEESPALG